MPPQMTAQESGPTGLQPSWLELLSSSQVTADPTEHSRGERRTRDCWHVLLLNWCLSMRKDFETGERHSGWPWSVFDLTYKAPFWDLGCRYLEVSSHTFFVNESWINYTRTILSQFASFFGLMVSSALLSICYTLKPFFPSWKSL